MRRIGTLIVVLATAGFLGLSAHAGAAGLVATTQGATSVKAGSAVLNGELTPLSLATTYYFDFGTTTSYGTQTPARNVTLLTSLQPVTASVTGLKANTTYHYRVVVGEGTTAVFGDDLTFKTGCGQNCQGQSTDTQSTTVTTTTTTTTGTDTPGGGDQGEDESGPAGTSSPTGTDSAPAFPANPVTPVGVAPVIGKNIGAAAAAGTVRVRLPGSAMFVPLEGSASLPVGSTVDARKGTVSVLAARDGAGATQPAEFQGAVFKIRQDQRGKGLTDVYLAGGDFRSCRPAATRKIVAARARPRTVRRLWGHDQGGRFRTHGQRAVAAVRGTTWMVADRCDGTLTKVTSGAVAVTDRVRHKTVLVKAGHSYLARARR